MSEEENTRLVQQAYRDFQNGDIQGVLGSLSEDVEWVTTQLSGVPVGGTYHGVEEAGRFFSSLGDAQEPRHFEPREFVAQGEKVVALGHYAWHSGPPAGSGRATSPTCLACATGRSRGSKSTRTPPPSPTLSGKADYWQPRPSFVPCSPECVKGAFLRTSR